MYCAYPESQSFIRIFILADKMKMKRKNRFSFCTYSACLVDGTFYLLTFSANSVLTLCVRMCRVGVIVL